MSISYDDNHYTTGIINIIDTHKNDNRVDDYVQGLTSERSERLYASRKKGENSQALRIVLIQNLEDNIKKIKEKVIIVASSTTDKIELKLYDES